MNIDMEYFVNMFKKYIDIPSPSGDTNNIINVACEEFLSLNMESKLTNKGSLITSIKGKNDEEELTISAHVDTLGLMVKEITSNGRLKFQKIGGGTWNTSEGENCYIINRHGNKIRGSILPRFASSHIYGKIAYDTIRDEENMLVRIDEKVKTKKDVLDLGINVGDFIYLDTRTEITENGFIKSRYIDNKSAVAMVFTICKYLKQNSIVPRCTINFFLSNYEEVGHGISAMPKKTKEFIAIDIGVVGEGQESDEFSVSIAAKDHFSPYNFDFRNRLVSLAEKNNIAYKVDVYNYYGSDATQAATSGIDVNFASLGPGVDASHHYERTHIESIENTIKLLLAYIV